MAFNKVFNSEEVARLKKLIQEGDQVLYEVDALQTGLRETVKAIAEEMEIRPAILNKAIKIANKANFGEESEKGFLLWDLDNKTCNFIQVANRWGFKTFRFDKEAIENINNINLDLPEKAFVRIFLSSADYNVTTQKHITPNQPLSQP